jgi:hypothetical protein
LRLVPTGYPSDACKPVSAPKDALAQVSCDKNSDVGGPLSATYTLVENKAALDAACSGGGDGRRCCQCTVGPGDLHGGVLLSRSTCGIPEGIGHCKRS